MSSHNSAPLISVKYILRWGAEHIGISWYLNQLLTKIRKDYNIVTENNSDIELPHLTHID